MAKAETMHTRIEPELKADAESILRRLGLSAADAINVYFRQIMIHNGIPFEIKLPAYNVETIEAMEGAKNGKVKRFSDAEAMFEDLGI